MKATFSTIFNMMAMFALMQPNEPERQQAAQFGVALRGRHPVGWEGVGASHASLLSEEMPLPNPRLDICARNSEHVALFQM
ncbi:hypothetical protein IG197_11495 [Aminobacter sp. SR38]|uniref:hypothetical protein n=1 Tax=Aminobacter sp. SR38 TaxID=2774562 RepID=UPI00177F948E|nr:hypothetical protein [Aminobacter sp. SR38]QOF73626.1 hypothetical protein IG197_11495 [Aminobacter sp. SR38]